MTEPTITAASATRRLADGLFREAQESDPSLCATHDTSFANFLSHLVNRSASSATGRHTEHGRGVFTDDAARFSKRCDEARVETAAEARRVVQAVIAARNNNNNDVAAGAADSTVVLLSEWKTLCRAHPVLLRTTLERAMPRSETTATALVADTPVTILPARKSEHQEQRGSSSSSSSSGSSSRNNHSGSSDDDDDGDRDKTAAASFSSSSSSSETRSASSSPEGKSTTKQDTTSSGSLNPISSAVFSGWTYATDWAQRAHQWLERFIAGGIAGGVAKSVIAPGDRVKIIFQVNRGLVFSLGAAFTIASQIVQRNGPFGLWAGHGATLLRVVPYASISFASFEFYHLTFRSMILVPEELDAENRKQKKIADGAGSWRQILLRFICGAAAGATATTITYPLDLLRARYAAHSLKSSGKPYPSYLTGLRHIYKTEGLGKLYGGLGPTLLGIIPYAGASFTVFETLKAKILSRNVKKLQEQQQQRGDNNTSNDQQDEDEVPQELATWQRLIAGALSGLVAQSLTYPLDIVRRRMQVHPEESKNMLHTLSTIYREEGIRRGLYKGLTMNWIKGPIAVGVSFTINDYIKSRTQAYHSHVALLAEDDEDFVEFGDTTAAAAELHKQQQEKEEAAAALAKKNKNHHKKSISSTEAAVRYLHISERIACGAMAGAAAKIWTIPFDRYKLMMALGRSFDSTSLRALLTTQNPWQGAAGMMLRVAPFAAVSYATFDAAQPFARRVILTKEPTFFSDMIAGSFGAAIATVVCHPMDVLRSRVALSESPPFASYVQGLKTETLSSLYTGLRPALIGVCPLAGFSFAVYHEGKRRYDDGSFTTRLGLGTAAGIVGQLVSYPMNIARRKAVASAVPEQQGRLEMLESESLLAAARKEGGAVALRQMYRRMPLGWTFGTATLALSFSIHDHVRDKLIALRRRQNRDLLLRDPTL